MTLGLLLVYCRHIRRHIGVTLDIPGICQGLPHWCWKNQEHTQQSVSKTWFECDIAGMCLSDQGQEEESKEEATTAFKKLQAVAYFCQAIQGPQDGKGGCMQNA